ncbi:MAG: dinitrogenase iron-molybdenum cofactor, partial [Cutibacterium acnes]|nr:dinitrogenase iron-molybdenum cofactor [Cutibacterium acnes]
HDVVACVATHAGMGMQRTLAAMKVPLLPATLPRARESVEHAMISAYADTKGTEES